MMFKNLIIKVLLIMNILIIASSCLTTRLTNVPNTTISTFEKDRIEILGHAEGNAGGGKVWILFIPIGWSADSWLESTAYKNALKSYPNADGLIDQTINYNRIRVPLVVVTVVAKKVNVTGIAYHIRTDKELEEYLKNKKQEGKE